MLATYEYPEFAYRQSTGQREGRTHRHPVVIIGAGPVGLTAALECAARGLPAVVLDDSNTVSIGSRAVCYAKRPLEIWDRLGVGDRMVEKGVSWKVGKVFFREDEVYSFDLLPECGHKRPAMRRTRCLLLVRGAPTPVCRTPVGAMAGCSTTWGRTLSS